MTSRESTFRLCIYVINAMIAAALAGVMSVDLADPRQVAAFVLGVLAAAFNTLRAYIDKSPSQVTHTPPPDP